MTQNANLQSRAIAMVALLAMIVAPLCAPLCSSQACAHASAAQNTVCHSTVAASNDAPQTAINAIRICGLQELPTAALNERTNSLDPVKRSSAAHAPLNLFPVTQAGVTVTNGARDPRPEGDSGATIGSFQPTILRI